ncbi:MAG: MltA domain-containing protein [Deltaproteobacteria bacterium]|nr:MAG: MltA domain-containing protein [Deltaproteobacteria bacterium]
MNDRAMLGWVLLLCLALLSVDACAPRLSTPDIGPEQALIEVSPEQLPLEADDLERKLLERAIRKSLLYYDRLPEETEFRFGPERVTLSRARRSLETFLALLIEKRTWQEIEEAVRERFIVFRSVGRNDEYEVLFTGYFEPTLLGSLTPDENYRFPIYGVPDDLVKIDLGRFRDRYQGVRLVGRYEGKRVVPYYSREEIDSDGLLLGKGYELVWVADPVERFFLQIQGSGRIRLLNNESFRINYAASNGWPYRSIGKLMIDNNLIPKEAMSMQAIRRYLKKHPERIEEILNYNQSYVFFQVVDAGPMGSISVSLTPGRSIATDPRFFPRGALAFIECAKPIFARDGVIMDWQPFRRYVLNQDSGGAIRGPGRVDLYWGSGPYSRIAAGHLKHPGSLYFLVLKE